MGVSSKGRGGENVYFYWCLREFRVDRRYAFRFPLCELPVYRLTLD